MSATPRPWAVDDSGSINELKIVHKYLGGLDEVASLLTDEDEPTPEMRADADLIVTAVNAFDTLLAAAKAAAQDVADSEKDMSPIGQIADAIDVLDAAHPGWREWTA